MKGLPRATAPIALFDSGVGGIGVLREVKKILPREDLLYFGDDRHAPYGNRPPDEIYRLVREHADRLLHRCKALVLACNTATAVAATALRQDFPTFPIIGMEPALKPALHVAKHPRILVLATAATLAGDKFAEQKEQYRDVADVLPLAAPGLVKLVESGITAGPAITAYLQEILAPLGDILPFDAIVLGCTHFPFAGRAISAFFGNAPIFEGSGGTARRLASELAARDLLTPHHTPGHIMLTGGDEKFLRLARRLFAAGYDQIPCG